MIYCKSPQYGIQKLNHIQYNENKLDFGNVKAPNVTSGFCEVRVAPSLYVCVVFCRSLFVLLFLFIWSLYCLSFVDDLQLLITPLVFSNFFKCIGKSFNTPNRRDHLVNEIIVLRIIFEYFSHNNE